MPLSETQATRSEGLRRLLDFVPRAGRAYAATRNYDHGPADRSNVSTLSPYLRHRLITEAEVVGAVLGVHSFSAAEKFIQEVCWRTYWKGWLEQRPQIWVEYLDTLSRERTRLRDDIALAARVAAAERGATGIPCFDSWALELAETGYLHNHARMWFASIWIFTLRLPWVLGANFFYCHLLDGDPASNTLSWRWVAGLHTRGKTYLARPDNIATYTSGRFQPGPEELQPFAVPLTDEPLPASVRLPAVDAVVPNSKVVLLLTEEDLAPESWPLEGLLVVGVALFRTAGCLHSPPVQLFKAAAIADASKRAVMHWSVPVCEIESANALIAFSRKLSADCAVTSIIPVGHLKPQFARLAQSAEASGLPVKQLMRRWDRLFWPHAKAGFFKLKVRIPAVLDTLALDPQESLL